MRVFVENAPDPLGIREEKHVLSVRGGPVRNGHADPFGRHNTAQTYEKKRGYRQHYGKAVQPYVPCRTCHPCLVLFNNDAAAALATAASVHESNYGATAGAAFASRAKSKVLLSAPTVTFSAFAPAF